MDDRELYIEIGNKIRARRKGLGMTISDLAKAMNRTVSTVSKYETGAIQISIGDLLNASQILSMDFFSMLSGNYYNNDPEAHTRYEKYYVDKVYLYWYNGLQNVIRTSVIENNNSDMKAVMYCDLEDIADYYKCKYVYYGDVYYNDTNVSWILHNDAPPFDIITVRTPMLKDDINTYRKGLLTCITYFYQDIAARVVISSKPMTSNKELLEILKISRSDIKYIRETNLFMP